jgi:hypothetical protein
LITLKYINLLKANGQKFIKADYNPIEKSLYITFLTDSEKTIIYDVTYKKCFTVSSKEESTDD